jgi:hypothetical protein
MEPTIQLSAISPLPAPIWFGVLMLFVWMCVEREDVLTLALGLERDQRRLVRFLRHLAGLGLRNLADMMDRRIYLVSDMAELLGMFLIFVHKMCTGNTNLPPNIELSSGGTADNRQQTEQSARRLLK